MWSGTVAWWLVCALVLLLGGPLSAQTGVSDDRVNLPEGPGSLDGIGDNTGVDPNMGAFRYSYPLTLPRGWNGTTPSLSFSYSSSAGSGLMGIGWSVEVQSIERASLYGLPEYSEDDLFVVNGSELLVRVSDGDPAEYRARREGAFVRYLWHDADGGGDGYWEVQNPDGTRSFYGADARGVSVDTARLTGAAGVFRYLLTETVDTANHSLRYDYQAVGSTLQPSAIRWAFVSGTPLYEVRFRYEDRPDPLSDARPGFNERTTQRLIEVDVRAAGATVRRYAVTYEDGATSGGLSRVQRIVQYGSDGGEYPIDLRLSYSQSIGAACEGAACRRPFLVSMPSLGVDISSGAATLVDLNGDALPDFVDSSGSGAHRIFFNRLVEQADGSFRNTFDAPVESSVGTGSGFGIASPYVQVLDVNGDGFADLLHAQRAEVLRNEANGDWEAIQSLAPSATEGLPDFAEGFEFGDDELPNIRFLDYNNDRRIDVLRSEGNTITEIYANNGDAGFLPVTGVGVIGAGFEQGLQLADMNGDGLLDPVRVLNGEVSWKLNLGHGRWTATWTAGINGPTLTESELDLIELEDINGDALDDLVLVTGNVVRYWLNRGGVRFDDEAQIDSSVVAGIPERTSSTTVLFADMNASGSTDIVWVTSSGAVTYLEIFPLRPNLLTRVESGIGFVSEIEYGTSVEHMTRDGGAEAWPTRLPFAMNVVDSINVYDLLNRVDDITTYAYHDGFYDGIERQFRGYARVESRTPGDEFEESSLTERRFHVGDIDPYYAGLPIDMAVSAVNDRGTEPLLATSTEYDDCAVAGVPTSGLRFPVRFVCTVATEELIQERADPGEWVRKRMEMAYDGYGNVIEQRQLGIVDIGGAGCGPCERAAGEFGDPCGATCEGDEMYSWSTYITPPNTGDAWILRLPSSQRYSARSSGDEYAETRTYYDGTDFVGLPLGQLTHGRVKRVEERTSTADAFSSTERYAHDEHGNVVESWGPRATASNRIERRQYTYEDGLFFRSSDVLLTDAAGQPITLRAEVVYDRAIAQPTEMTGWYVVEDTPSTASRVTRYEYDEFGRVVATYRPGDSAGAPSSEFEYDLASPVSRIITRNRTQAGMSEPDVVQIACQDGLGRVFQFRDRITDTSWQVSSYRRLSREGEEIELYQPYRSASEQCDVTPPEGNPPSVMRYDALGRYAGMREPVDEDGTEYIEYRMERYPRSDAEFDPHDNDPTSPFFNTPTVRFYDGLERTVAVERQGTGGRVLRHTYAWDVYGYPSRVTDPEGVTLSQSAEPDGRITQIRDAHRGTRTFAHDDSGNIVAETDARGVTVRSAYDGANRRIAEWDDADREGTLTQWFYDRAPGCSATECSNAAGLLAGTRFRFDGGDVNEFYGYDLRRQPTLVRRDLAGFRYEFRSTYDAHGRLVGEEMPGGIELSYERDAMGRIVRVPGMVESIVWDDRGLAEAIELSNGVTSTYLHDVEMRLTDVTAQGPTGEAVLAYSLTRDSVGNVLTVADGRAANGIPSGNVQYAYDAFYRLTNAEYDAGRDAFAETLTWEWSDGGNLASRASSLGERSSQDVRSIGYGGAGAGQYALTELNGTTYAYDSAGHQVRRGTMELEWDALGRLSRAREGEASVVGEYAYDAFDARMYKREGSRETFYFSDRYEVRDGIATVFLDLDSIRLSRLETASLAAQVLPDLAPLTGAGADLEADGDGQIRAADAWVSQAITVGAVTLSGAVAGDVRTQLASSAHRLLLGESGEARSYYHQNHTGNVAAVTDDEGRVFERTEYYAEGQVRWSSGGGKVESYGYSGKEHDASGLLYFGARYLDPITGRWVSPDPTFINVDNAFPNWGEEATNPYSYALGNPVNNRDPDGRFIDNVVGAVVGAVGGALIAGIAEVIQQRNEIKSGSRTKMNWKSVAVKAGISATIGGLVGASGVGGWAALGIGLGIKAGASVVTTTMKWRAEKNLGQSRQANTSLADKKRLEKRARWWHRAAIGTDVAVAAVGIGMGAADIVGLTTASHIFGKAAVGVVSTIVSVDAAVSLGQAGYDFVTGHKADRARAAERHAATPTSQSVAQDSVNTASDSDASSGTAVRPRSRASSIRPRAISRTRSQPALRIGAHRARSNSAPGR